MKSKTKPASTQQNGLEAVAKQTNVISALCKQGMAEAKAKGKTSASTFKETKQAVEKLGKLIAALEVK